MGIPNLDNKDFLLERYKYILSRKTYLNGKTFKIVTYYQVLLLATGSAFYAINTSPEIYNSCKIYSNGLMGLLFLVTFFLISILIGGILSWVNIRKDEDELLRLACGIGKNKIAIKDIFTWYEFYICIAMFIITSGILISYYLFF